MKKYFKLLIVPVVFFALTLLVSTNAEAVRTPAIVVDDDAVECPDADYATIADAVAAAIDGDRIHLCDGYYNGVELDKTIHFKGLGDEPGDVYIQNGPTHSSGLIQGFRLLAGSDGSSFEGLWIQLDLGIMNGDGVDDVVVYNNYFVNNIQAISNWRGDNWSIAHNTIDGLRTACGGGIGILIGAYDGVDDAVNNTVVQNTITGTLNVNASDCGGYSGTGIVLFADHRFGRSGGEVSGNRVEHNTVSLTSNNPTLVDVVGIELTDTRDDELVRDVFNNVVRSNFLQGTAESLDLTPDNLDDYNVVTRNRVN